MHRSSILWLLCIAMGSACVVKTRTEPTVVDHRTREEPPPPVEVRDHRTPREEPPPPPPVEVRDHRTHEPPPPPAHRPWDSTGWTLLGEKLVEGRRDHDTITLGRREGGFTKLMLVVEGGDLELTDLTIVYANGKKHQPNVKQFFREGERTRAIDLEGKAPAINRIYVHYGNIPGGGKAKVQIWGRKG